MRDVCTCAHGGPPPLLLPLPATLPYSPCTCAHGSGRARRGHSSRCAAPRRSSGPKCCSIARGTCGYTRPAVTRNGCSYSRYARPQPAGSTRGGSRGWRRALLQPRRACAGPGGNQREQARRRRVVRFLRLVPRVWNLTKSHGLTGTRAARSAQAAAGRWSGPGRARASTALGAVSRTQRACRSETQKILCAASSSARRRSVLLCADRSSPSRRIAFTELADAGEPGLSYCASTGRERAEA
jgi:hypothetical protein